MVKYRGLRGIAIWLVAGMALIAGACLLFLRGDPDFQWIGPKTDEVSKLYALLDTPIDMRDFRETRTVFDSLQALDEQLKTHGKVIVLDEHAFRKQHNIEIGLVQIRFSPMSPIMSLRQVFKVILEQIPSGDGAFLLWHYGHLELTTAEEIRMANKAYTEGNALTPMDHFRQAISNLTGRKHHLPIPAWKPAGTVKRLEGA